MKNELELLIKNKKLSNEKWQELVCDLIDIVSENKYNRIYYLLEKENLLEDLSFDKIVELLDGIVSDSEDGKYCDESYFDYAIDEDVVIGDESWIDEIDMAFRGIQNLFNQKKYKQVIECYEKIFLITERKYEELHSLLPNYYHIEEILESKVNEHYMNYLDAIYYSEIDDKISKFAEVLIEHRYNYMKNNILHNFCEKHEEFRKEIIPSIVKKCMGYHYNTVSQLIFQLLLEEDGIKAVFIFLKENVKENIYIFTLFCRYMQDNQLYEELLKNLLELENVNMYDNQRESVFQKIIDIAKILGDEKIKEKYLYKINDLNPRLNYTLQICKKIDMSNKIKEIEKLNKKFIVNEENNKEKILIELILGNIQNAFQEYEKINKYDREDVKDLITYYLFKFGNESIKEKKLLSSQIKAQINAIDDNVDIDEIFNIMQFTKKDNLIPFVLEAEKRFSSKISRKTKEILGRQERGYYSQIAKYLVILVEYYYEENRKEEFKQLLYIYQLEYKRYNLYQKCIKEELAKSSVKIL